MANLELGRGRHLEETRFNDQPKAPDNDLSQKSVALRQKVALECGIKEPKNLTGADISWTRYQGNLPRGSFVRGVSNKKGLLQSCKVYLSLI